MDIALIGRRLEAGEKLKIKYCYPQETSCGNTQHGVRSDKLVDVSTELGRLYVNFRGQTPIWLEVGEVQEVVSDDGVYEDFPA